MQDMAAGKASRCFAPVQMLIDGSLTADRQHWLQDAMKFGESRFGSSPEVHANQAKRMELLELQGRWEKIDGRPPDRIPFFDVISARGSLMKDKAVDPHGTPAELFKNLPFVSVWCIWQVFQERYDNLTELGPQSWKLLKFFGLPKERDVTAWEKYRWICNVSNMERWYVRSFKPTYNAMWRGSRVNSFGFR